MDFFYSNKEKEQTSCEAGTSRMDGLFRKNIKTVEQIRHIE